MSTERKRDPEGASSPDGHPTAEASAASEATTDPVVEAPDVQDEATAPLDETQALRVERDQLQDRLLRLAAEFDNFRKRSAREWREVKERASAEVLLEMLEFADNLERALGAESQDGKTLRKGVDLILQQLQAKLKRFGVEPMDARGKPFDPQCHEAVLMVESEEIEGSCVVDVVLRGYTLHGEVLRPARVTVAR